MLQRHNTTILQEMTLLSFWLGIPIDEMRPVIYPSAYGTFTGPGMSPPFPRTVTVPQGRCLLIVAVDSYGVPVDDAGNPVYQKRAEVHCYDPPQFKITKSGQVIFGGTSGTGLIDLSDLRFGFFFVVEPGDFTYTLTFTDTIAAGFKIHANVRGYLLPLSVQSKVSAIQTVVQ